MSQDARKPITTVGKKLLDQELKRLINVERPKVIKAIEEARAHGDLSENADFDAAKEQQAILETRIADIKNKLATAQVVDTSTIKSDTVTFGACVVLEGDDGEKVTYQIVGEDEADAKNGKISIRSPLAQNLINRKKEDSFEFSTPKGEREYTVIDFYFK